MPGKGKMQITGKLGEVMQESVKAAKSFVRYKSVEFGIVPPLFEKKDFHIHVPEGATPKDGPSAGIAIVTSIISSITGIPVNKDVAMTGEVTLRGNVLQIGGLKEDLIEIPETIRNSIEIVSVKTVEEVLKHALTKELKPVKWAEIDQVSNKNKEKSEVTSAH